MPCYLVERYLPGLSAEDVHAAVQRLKTVAEEMTTEGITIGYLSSAFVPEEEACFCQLEAPSREAVALANERAAFPFARILTVDPRPEPRHVEER
jgi:Nickel responsive protein SCO4226-like